MLCTVLLLCCAVLQDKQRQEVDRRRKEVARVEDERKARAAEDARRKAAAELDKRAKEADARRRQAEEEARRRDSEKAARVRSGAGRGALWALRVGGRDQGGWLGG